MTHIDVQLLANSYICRDDVSRICDELGGKDCEIILIMVSVTLLMVHKVLMIAVIPANNRQYESI